METAIATAEISPEISPEIIQKLVLDGDLSKMNQAQKVDYYNRFCQSLGLNQLTQPFQIIKFNGKEKLYAMKDCTEQLRKIHMVSITEITSQELRGVFVVTAKAIDKTGKTDAATGAVSIEGLRGEGLANALMKAETKAKRRVTLSICGLGMLDESELDTMPVHQIVTVTGTTLSDTPAKEKMGKSHPKYPKAKDNISTGRNTVEKLLEYVDLEPDVKEELEKCQVEAIKGLCGTAGLEDEVVNQYVRDYMGEVNTGEAIISEIKTKYNVQFIND